MDTNYQTHLVKSTDRMRMSLALIKEDSKHTCHSKNMCDKTKSKYFPYLR